jgi:hypothetical protein
LAEIYHQGFQDGVVAGDSTDFKIKLAEVLNNTKGIGPKLFERIMATVKELGL